METEKAIFERRTIRFFEKRKVEKEKIKKILEAMTNAPNANNAQQWYFVAITSPEKRNKLREILIEAYLEYLEKARSDIDAKVMEKVRSAILSGLYDAPLFIAAYSDIRNLILRREFEEFERRLITQSVSAAIENALLMAWDLGLSGVWLGVAKLKEREINSLLEIPEGLELEGVIGIGYPAKIGKKRPRKPLEEVSKVLRKVLSPLLFSPLLSP